MLGALSEQRSPCSFSQRCHLLVKTWRQVGKEDVGCRTDSPPSTEDTQLSRKWVIGAIYTFHQFSLSFPQRQHYSNSTLSPGSSTFPSLVSHSLPQEYHNVISPIFIKNKPAFLLLFQCPSHSTLTGSLQNRSTENSSHPRSPSLHSRLIYQILTYLPSPATFNISSSSIH